MPVLEGFQHPVGQRIAEPGYLCHPDPVVHPHGLTLDVMIERGLAAIAQQAMTVHGDPNGADNAYLGNFDRSTMSRT
ncbi:hypothetical protein D3C84_1129580 [compost metagenome]